MKKVSNLSILLGLSILATATGANAETINQSQVQSKSTTDSTLQSSLPATEVKLNESETIRAISSELKTSKEVAENVTSVSQLSDVKPTDWAFTALQSLVERYGCIAGYPDRSYRGQGAMTRYEFASGLNACLSKINELLASGLADKVAKEDLAALKKLQEEFTKELATLSDRVNGLEAKTNQLESQQFATTTKLNGLAFVNITSSGANSQVQRETGRRDNTGRPSSELVNNPNTTLSSLVWLNLLTSFTGKDLLTIQLVAGNGDSPNSDSGFSSAGLKNTWGTPFTDQTPSGSGANTFALQELSYKFPVFNDKTSLKIGPSIIWYRTFDTNRFTLFFNGSGTFNSINSTLSSPVKQGSGAILTSSIGDQWEVMLGYLAENNTFLPSTRSAGNPQEGLFGGTSILTGQLTFKPSRDFNLRLLYSRANQQANPAFLGGTVGGLAPINGLADDGFGGSVNNAPSDIYIVNFDWLVIKEFGLFGRYSLSNSYISPTNAARSKGTITANSFQIGMAFPDLFKESALGTISFAMPFNYTGGRNFLVSGSGDGGVQYDLETSYFFPISRNLAIIPNFYITFNPNNFSSNPTVFTGNVRMQFNF